MFERYTERARRVLFFARYEATDRGVSTIDTEHLLIGITRESSGLAVAWVRLNIARDTVARLSAELPRHRRRVQGVSTFEKIENIRDLVEQLARMARDPGDARALADRVRDALDELFGGKDE